VLRTNALSRKLARLESLIVGRRSATPTLDRLRCDRAGLMALAGLPPDPWQEGLLRSDAARLLLLCSRQANPPWRRHWRSMLPC
jgi:hypothetical protein